MITPFEQAVQTFSGKRVLIFGLGLLGGGVGDARFFNSIGAKVTVTDLKSETELADSIQALSHTQTTFHLGGHQPSDIETADYILRNPSVPQDHPLLELARQQHKPILMRSSLFVDLSQIPVIGITGTRGKTTTTTMIHRILSQLSPKKVLLCGNINGISDLELLAQIEDRDQTLAVMELSSWQLQGFAESRISPHIAVVTNLLPDHLNRYASLDAYYHDKQAIILHQNSDDYAILNSNQPQFKLWTEQANSHIVWFDDANLPAGLHLRLRGNHNQLNAAAAIKVAEVLNLDLDQAVEILNHFEGVNFRFQTIATYNGVEFINDTTATTPDALLVGLNSLLQKPIIICGGADKQLPLESLIEALNQQTKHIVLLPGTGTDRIRQQLKSSLVLGEADSMEQAVKLAVASSQPGDTVLLSPGFASFGLFVNEFDRGEKFNQCVHALGLPEPKIN